MKTGKNWIAVLLAVLMLASVGCTKQPAPNTEEPGETTPTPPLPPEETAALLWNDAYADGGVFAGQTVFDDLAVYVNGAVDPYMPTEVGANDCRYIFTADGQTRAVNMADGYALTLPGDNLTFDFMLGALRSKYIGGDFVLTVTKETENPYGGAEGWETYYDEWLTMYIANERYLRRNNLEYTREPQTRDDLLPGYTVNIFSIVIVDNENIQHPYYNIAVLRQTDVYDLFYLMVYKSSSNHDEAFDALVAGFRTFEPQGAAQNHTGAFELILPDTWNDETRAYFEKLQNQDSISWGVFTDSMPDERESYYNQTLESLNYNQSHLQEALATTFEVIPTYTHLGWEQNLLNVPLKMANEVAGGDGFNGLPVLHLSYQFTTRNNTELSGYTPVFAILNGYYDDHFRKVAADIKAYGKPVLFRLNNEMDTDWTSYCGMVSLLDPDIFIMNWERMYRIFQEEGVDNCIWIFNPMARSTPYSKWGDWLNYLPEISNVQVLGLTGYEMGNNYTNTSFSMMYRALYERSMPYFENFPWSISEFGCGAGGEKQFDYTEQVYKDTVKGRNKINQADWVRDMFRAFNNKEELHNDYVRNIKVAIWFSANDYVELDGQSYITNYFRLDDELTDTFEEFRKGLNPS